VRSPYGLRTQTNLFFVYTKNKFVYVVLSGLPLIIMYILVLLLYQVLTKKLEYYIKKV